MTSQTTLPNWTTKTQAITTGKDLNKSLKTAEGTLVPLDRVQEAYSKLNATGFWVVSKSKRSGAKVPTYVSDVNEHYVHLMTYGATRPMIVFRGSFHALFKLAED